LSGFLFCLNFRNHYFYFLSKHHMKKIAFLLLVFFASQFIFARQNIPFNQDWAFKKGPFTTSELNYSSLFKGNWQLVQIPHTWNAVDMQSKQINAGYYSTNERFYVGDSYYRKTFVPKAEWKNKRIFIKFEGVGANAEVYVNTNPLKSTINKNNVSFQSDANNERTILLVVIKVVILRLFWN